MCWKAFVKPLFLKCPLNSKKYTQRLCVLWFGAVKCIFILQKPFIVDEPQL